MYGQPFPFTLYTLKLLVTLLQLLPLLAQQTWPSENTLLQRVLPCAHETRHFELSLHLRSTLEHAS